jgi:hypothetical protein
MTIFVLVMPTPQPVLAARILSDFNGNSFPLTVDQTQWLISASGTAQEICAKLGMYDPANPNAAPTGLGIVFASAGYFGRGPSNVWEWIRVKLEAPPPQSVQAPATNPPVAASG